MNLEELKNLIETKPRNRKEAQQQFEKIQEFINGPFVSPMDAIILQPIMLLLKKELDKKVRGFEPLAPYTLMPQRATKKSAGYDIRANEGVVIFPGTKELVKTGMTAYMLEDEFLDLRIRSGLANKYQLTLQNDAGVVDSDYYGKEIGFIIRNEGTAPFEIVAGDRIGQGIFSKYLTTDDDEPADQERTSGFGHTGLK